MTQSDTETLTELARKGDLVAYFGFGSLVNRATLGTPFLHAAPVRVSGWRRQWRPRPDMPGFPAALLTVFEADSHGCDGLLVFDHAAHLGDVDRREARYRRVELSTGMLDAGEAVPADIPVYVYQALENVPTHKKPPKILRSYLDTVMQGFLREHGAEGLKRFVSETDAFHIPIHEDRHTPIYPRHVRVEEEERALFDEALAHLKHLASE